MATFNKLKIVAEVFLCNSASRANIIKGKELRNNHNVSK